MSKIRLYGDTSGFVELAAPDVAPDAQWTVANTAAGYLYAGTRYYTSSSTFDLADPLGTGDIGLKAVYVRVQAGGGGGGGAALNATSGAGGGGGAYTEGLILASALTSPVTVTCGSGGSGGAAGANDGTAGGSSLFGTIEAGGGGGGVSGSGVFVDFNGGTVISSAGFNRSGQGGTPRIASNAISGSFGGSSLLGWGAQSRLVSDATNGRDGQGFGGGGSGGFRPSTTNVSGGNGSAGVVIVNCFV